MNIISKRFAANSSWLPLAAATLIIVFAVACGNAIDEDDDQVASGTYEGDDGLVAELVFEPDPPQAGDVDLQIDLSVDGEPVTGATIDVEPWMPAHDHGANTVPVVEELDDGSYMVDDLSFSMAGHWELRLDVDWDDGDSQMIIDLEVEG